MTLDRFLPHLAFGPTLLAACLGISVSTTLPASAQGGGGNGATGAANNGGVPGSPAAAGQGSGSGRPGEVQPGTAGPGPAPGLAVDDLTRPQMREAQSAAGVAPSPEQHREQLEDLNEIARRLAPSVPAPAPGLEGAEPSR